jgi:exonuclease III
MKILFWNIRGLGGAGRRWQFKDLMSFHHLEVICLQETIKRDFSDHMLKDLVNGQDFS